MDLPAYLKENYGVCGSAKCHCNCQQKNCSCPWHGWRGTACPNFRSFNATSYEELGRAQQALVAQRGAA